MCNACERCYLSIANRRIPGGGAGCTPTLRRTIMFVGDTPTITDYKTQTIFNGRSTKIVSQFINDYKLTAWTIKSTLIQCVCAEPTEHYAETCYPNFIATIRKYKPTIIVAVGQFVYQFLKEEKYKSMASVVNKPVRFNDAILVPIYSPAYIMRNKCYSEYVKSFNLISDIFAELCKEYRYYR
jgi:uracil-DNA glycosylase family 4